MKQKLLIKRATMKGDGAQGNPRGYFLGKFKIDGKSKVFSADYVVYDEGEFLKKQQAGLAQMMTKTFREIGEALIIEFDDDPQAHPTDRQKSNFVKELIKHPEMRPFDSPKNGKIFWTYELGTEIAVRKAAKLADQIKVLNMLSGLTKKQKVNICFYFAPHLKPNHLTDVELFTLLGDTRTDENTGRPYGILIESVERIKAVGEYFRNTAESEMRTTIMKAIEFDVVRTTARGYEIDNQFIGVSKDDVYVYLKTNPSVYENYVLLNVAKHDSIEEEESDLEKVESVHFDLVNNVDYEQMTLEQLRDRAFALKIPRAKNYFDTEKLTNLIKLKIEENKKANQIPSMAV